MKTEGEVYRCIWRKKKGYEVQCLQPFASKASGRTIDEAVDLLRSQIFDLTGDGEAYLQFDPPLPEKSPAKSYFAPQYYQISHNDLIDWERPQERLYEGGICKTCRSGIGSRTDVPRVVKQVPKKDFAGFNADPDLRHCYSKRFLNHILPFVGDRIKLIPVQTKTGKRVSDFFELDFNPEIEVVALRNADLIDGCRCADCGGSVLIVFAKRVSRKRIMFLERGFKEDAVLLVGNGVKRVLAVNGELYKKISADKKLKGLVTEPMAMIDSKDVAVKPYALSPCG